jgi:hypothetical protein
MKAPEVVFIEHMAGLRNGEPWSGGGAILRWLNPGIDY